MASKGPKAGVPAVLKAGARPKAAPKPKFAAVEAEKALPIAEAEYASFPVIEPVPALEAAPQEVEVQAEAMAEAAEAVVEPAKALIEQSVEAAQPVLETVNEAAQPVLETVNEAVAAAATAAVKDNVMETIENNFNANANKAQAFFADFNDRAKGAVEKSTQLMADANEFAKGNVEAMVESTKIATNGMQALGQDAADYGRRSFESATAALKTLATVKSPADFFKLQSDYVRTSFDSYVAEASKNTEALIKLAGEAAQPLSNRVAVAAEKVKVAA